MLVELNANEIEELDAVSGGLTYSECVLGSLAVGGGLGAMGVVF